ncbi:MAG TPA: hemerythrin domain-containing protein [Polyangiaceae bacterium]|nr:hemerythrin domain-containing protein [Polyangiaceae bacterium]
MASPPNLLNDDGSASMATLFMMSHHAFRRDLARFARALSLPAGELRSAPLQQEWRFFHGALHGHHQMEDNAVFAGMKAQHPDLAGCIEGLMQDHRRIDPLLERGDAAFAQLPQATGDALAIVRELQALLDPHLTTEESQIAPQLRGAKQFPAPGSDNELEMYAQGFAWSTQGIAPQVVEQVFTMLPPQLVERLPAAREAFNQRCEQVWGSAQAGSATTPIPNGP